MLKPYALFGALSGILLIFYVRILDISKLIYTTTWGAYLGYLAILILPACIFLVFSKRMQTGVPFKYHQALVAGLLLALISASVYNLYTYLDIRFFNASHLKNQFEFTIRSMKEEGYTEREIHAKMLELKVHYWSMKPYINTYIWYIILGALFSLIIRAILSLKFKTKLNHIS